MVDDKEIKTKVTISTEANRTVFICYHCNYSFHHEDDIVVIGTHIIKNINLNKDGGTKSFDGVLKEEQLFHLDCWKKWFEESMNSCALNINDQTEKYLEFKEKNNPIKLLKKLGGLLKNGRRD